MNMEIEREQVSDLDRLKMELWQSLRNALRLGTLVHYRFATSRE